MPRLLKELGGKEWERLGLGAAAQEAEAWTPTWEGLLPLLPGPEGPGALHGERLAIIHLEGLDDAEGALSQLRKLDSRDGGANWLLFQLALQELSEETLSTWLERTDGQVEQALGAFIRVMLLDGDGSLGVWDSEDPGLRPGRQIMLMKLGRFEDLAADFSQEGTAIGLLLAATLHGKLKQPERQAELLGRASADERLLTAEAQLDLALAGRGEVVAALARRAEALEEHRALAAEAAATRMMLQLRDRRRKRKSAELDDAQAAAAWRHLDALVDRQPGALAEWYAAQAKLAHPPLAQAMALRAAELHIEEDRWEEALEALPAEAECTGSLAGLAGRYRLLCLSGLGRWAELASALAASVESAPEGPERELLAAMVVVTGIAHGSVTDDTAVGEPAGLSGLKRAFNGAWAALPGAALLAANRRAGRIEEVATLWTGLCESLRETGVGGLLPFGAAVALLKAGRLEEARAALKLDRSQVGDEPTTLAGMAIALHSRGVWAELVDVLARLSDQVSEPDATQLLREAAHIAAVESTDLRRSVELIRKTLERSPEDPALLQEAAAIDLRVGRYREAGVLLERAAAGVDPAASADLLCARGKILQEKLGDPSGAEKSYRRALKAHPLHVRSLHGLYHLLVKLQRFRDLPEVLHSLLHLTKTDAGRVKLLNNLASLHLKLWRTHSELEDADKCIRYSDEALTLRADNEVAVRNLVTVCEETKRWDAIVQRFEVDSSSTMALRALGRAQGKLKQWDAAAAALRRLGEISSVVEEGAKAALEAGDIYLQRLNDAETAEQCYRHALSRKPTLEAGRRLADLLRAQERPGDLTAVLEAQLSEIEGQDLAQLHVELGRLYGGAAGDAAAAVRHYNAALELDASNQEVMIALEPLLEQESNLSELARLLERRLQLIETGPEELRVLLRLGEIYLEFEDEQSALRMVTRLHYLYPGADQAVALAEKVYSGQKRFNELCELYERRVQFLEQQEDTEADRALVLKNKGNLELSELGSTATAAESFTRAMELAPEDGETLSLLESILSESEDWQKLLSLYERRANRLSEVADQIASLHQAARIAQQKLGDEAETARLYERIHALDPSDAESFGFLERKLERLKDDRRLAGLLEKRAETVSARAEAIECLLRAAAIREKVGDAARARTIYNRVIEREPGNSRALKALARISEALESWEEFLEVTKLQVEEETKPANKALLFFKCGSVLETKYHREEEAIRYYKQAIRTSASCLPALHSLRDLYSRREDWHRVVETLKTESSVWTDPKGKAGVLAQIADLYATKLGDHGEAFKYYREAIQNHPENMRAALALFEAYANQGSYADAAAWGEVYARQVQQRGSRAQRSEFFVRWADVLRRIGRYEDAAQYLVRAQELQPGQAETLYGLLDLCREAPEAYDFARAFDDLLKDATKRGDNLATAILLTACGVLAEQNGDVDNALDLYQRSLGTAGHKIRLAMPMADLLVLLGREDQAVELIGRCREEAKDESFVRWIEATQWLVEHEILWRRNYERAAERCEEALEEQPNRDDIRLLLAQVLVMLMQPDRATDEYQRICDKLAKHGLDLQLLAERYHALGLSAEKAGNLQAAESSWRRAAELAPDWPYPLMALARTRSAKGDLAAAEHELGKAVGDAHPDLLRARAALAARGGDPQTAVELCRRLVKLPEAGPGDQVMLARHLLSAGEKTAALDLLGGVIKEHTDYVPAIEELVRVGGSVGDVALARRASQVVSLAMGEERPKPPPLVREAIPKAFWGRLEKEIARNPIDALWHLLKDPLDRAFAPEPPASVLVVYPEVQLGATQMGALFGAKLEIVRLESKGTFMQLFGNRLMVSMDVSQLRILEVRSLLSLALTMVKLGYSQLFKLGPQRKLELATRLGELLTGDTDQYRKAAEFLAEQPRSKQRQVARVVSQHRIPAKAIDDAARSWLGSLEAASIKVALLLTEDLPSLARVLALQAGIQLEELEGGLLGAVPGLPVITEYYLSDDYQQMRNMLSVEEEARDG
jgi:tetratricopeptide (TPR) repeat protein